MANRDDSAATVIAIKSRRIVNYAIGLNANSIAITFPFFTHGITSNCVFAKARVTPTPAHVTEFLAEAAKSHGRVTVRPILNEDIRVAENKLAWRGTIAPSDRAARFRSYRRLLIRYARRHRPGVRPTHRGD